MARDTPQRELITRRYLRHDRRLADDALARLIAADDSTGDPDAAAEAHDLEEAEVERPVRLNDQRMAAVTEALEAAGARNVVDLGCGPGSLVRLLLQESWIDRVVGVDASCRALGGREATLAARRDAAAPTRARRPLAGSTHLPRQAAAGVRRGRGGGGHRASRSAATLGLRASRCSATPGRRRSSSRRPTSSTTCCFDGLADGQLRHRDHRFEWTRAQFASWCDGVCGRHDYTVRVRAGRDRSTPTVGAPTQMAVFRR